MKKITLIILLLAGPVLAETSALDTYNSLRGVKWGTHIKKLKKLNLEYKTNCRIFLKGKTYFAKNISQKFGRAKITSNS